MNSSTLKLGSSICVYNDTIILPNSSKKITYFPQNNNIKHKEFMGQSLVVKEHKRLQVHNTFVKVEASYCVSKAMRWWDKNLKPNMVEIKSAQHFVNALKSGGDQLVIVDFYSPGCGGCKSLHPKICQLAESNPDAIFLKVNYEELKPMCHALHIHVLPFFRFYRGASGRVSSFSCTISTIKKFKDALAKHSTERCSIGPTKGLDESELLKLASIGELSTILPVSTLNKEAILEEVVLGRIGVSNPLSLVGNNAMLIA